MSRAASRPTPERVRSAYVDQLANRMSERDWQIAFAVNRLRVASGEQIERLCFVDVSEGRSRIVTRSRVLARLVAWRVLVPLARRIGGARRGSSAQLFALDTAGTRLLVRGQLAQGERVRVRRPGTPGGRTLRHMTAVAELYVTLVELARTSGFGVSEFVTEPGCYWPNGIGGWLKPDAYAVLAREKVLDYWWIEHDEATESLPTIRRKIQTYLDFWRRGQRGPHDVVPRVLVSTITKQRRDAIAAIARRLAGAEELVTVALSTEAASYMTQVILE
jgi:hypothetical protein